MSSQKTFQNKNLYKIVGFKEIFPNGSIDHVILQKGLATGVFVCSIQRLKELNWFNKFSNADRLVLEEWCMKQTRQTN
jgi:hypothetical protein